MIKLNNDYPEKLKTTQKIILNYIRRLSNGQETLTIKELKKRIFENKNLFKLTFDEAFLNYAIKEQEKLENCKKENRIYDKYIRDFMKVIVFFIIILFIVVFTVLNLIGNQQIYSYILGIPIIAILSIAMIFNILVQIKIIIHMQKDWKKIEYTMNNPGTYALNTNIYVKMTKKGLEEKKQWEMLKKYLEEYSLIKDYTIESIEINKEFLVYATLFGIADNTQNSLGKYGPIMVYWA
jgi:uncharacterized membrane protein